MTPFLVTRAGSPGLSYDATRSQRYRTPTRGVRSPADGTTWLDDVAAAALVIRPGSAFSHSTAAQLLNLPLPLHLSEQRPLHVTTRGRAGRRALVAWHEAAIDDDIVRVANLPVTSPRRTWCDLGALLTVPELVAMADVILRRAPQALWVPPRVRGARNLRRAVELADAGSKSPRESMLRVAMHEVELPAPALNRDVIDRGEWIGCGDFVWEEFALYVEYDGEHHGDARQRHQDAQTRNRLMELGWTVRVITSRMRQREALDIVAEALRAKGWH